MDVCHEDSSTPAVMVMRRVFSGRIRVIVFVVSLIGLVAALLLLLRPPPASIVHASHPVRHKKVSVIVCLPHFSTEHQYKTMGHHLEQALTELKLEYELMVVATSIPQQATSWLQGTAHHFEIVNSQDPCEQTLPSLMSRVHYTVLLLIGGTVGNSSITNTLSRLLEPVTTEHCELVVGDTSKQQAVGVSQAALSLLLSPITETTRIPSSLLLAASKKALDGCEGIAGESGSLVAELLAKCYWNHWQMIQSTGVYSVSRPLSFTQVLSLYWHIHPILCVVSVIGVVSMCLICFRLHQYMPGVKLKSTTHNY